MSEYNKPLPLITELSKVFYDGCRDNRLLYQECADCGEVIFYPKQLCSNCMGHKLEWKASAGKGKIHSFTVCYDYVPPAFMSDVPFTLAIIKMDEGFNILSNIVNCDFNDLCCEMPVEVIFDPVTPEITLPRFQPAV